MDSVKVKAFGKLNLYLDIVGKRNDGYHLLRTVMQSVSVCDTLLFKTEEGEGFELVCDAPGFPKDNTNLICKAAEAFLEFTEMPPRGKLTVTVDKKIPMMAGMAGGSADCAATIVALNELYGNPLSKKHILELAAKLGADVPFTATGGTVLCEGIGEQMTKLSDLNGLYFAVVQPEIKISTPSAYKAYDSKPPFKKKSYPRFAKALELKEPQLIADGMFNALEIAVADPNITEIKERFIASGALGAQMTGSGSAVFGIFDDWRKAEACIDRMNIQGYPYAAVLEPVNSGLEITKNAK